MRSADLVAPCLVVLAAAIVYAAHLVAQQLARLVHLLGHAPIAQDGGLAVHILNGCTCDDDEDEADAWKR